MQSGSPPSTDQVMEGLDAGYTATSKTEGDEGNKNIKSRDFSAWHSDLKGIDICRSLGSMLSLWNQLARQ